MYPHQIFLGGQIKEDRMGVARGLLGEKRNIYRIWWVNQKKINNFQDLGVDGSKILKLFMNTYRWTWTGFIRLRTQKSGEVL